MNADDFRDYMLSFLFLRYLSDNYETAAKKELGEGLSRAIDSMQRPARRAAAPWYEDNPDDVAEFEKQMRRKVHYVIEPHDLWTSIANMARTQNGELLNTLQEGFKYIENESFESTFNGLFSEINLASDKLGKKYEDRNAKLCTIIQKIAEGLAEFSTDSDTLGDAYEYLIGQFAAGSGKKAGEFYTPQQISASSPPSSRWTARSRHRQEEAPGQRAGLRLRLRLAAAQRAQAHGAARHRQDLRAGKEHHHLQPRAHEHAAARGEGFGVRNLPRRHADQRLGHAARDQPGQEALLRCRGRQSAVQLPLGPDRGDGRGRALQELRPGARSPPPTSPFCCTAFTT